MDARNTHMCLPCLHMAMCRGCSAAVMASTAACPLCRAKVTIMVEPRNAGVL